LTPRIGIWLAAAASAFVVAACGGGADPEPAPEAPALPRALAQDLAAQSEQIADTLAAGDVCGAAQQADELNAAAVAAADGGRVPAVMREELLSTVELLVNEINCPAPEPPATEEKEEEEDECEELEQQKKALDERIKETEDEEEKQALEEEKKALEEEIKACKEERED
jgi:hypothetical protein